MNSDESNDFGSQNYMTVTNGSQGKWGAISSAGPRGQGRGERQLGVGGRAWWLPDLAWK